MDRNIWSEDRRETSKNGEREMGVRTEFIEETQRNKFCLKTLFKISVDPEMEGF